MSAGWGVRFDERTGLGATGASAAGGDTRARRADRPVRWYRTMREEEPARYGDDRGCWDVFGNDDVERVLRDYDAFSSNMDAGGGARNTSCRGR